MDAVLPAHGPVHQALEELNTTLETWLANPPSKEVPPELLEQRTETIATEILKTYARMVDPEGKELKQKEEELAREEGEGGGAEEELSEE